MIQWAFECARATGATSIIIATDDERIRNAASAFGAESVMTAKEHASGTDRIAEVARIRGFAPGDIVVNLQGDEPLTPPNVLVRVAQALTLHPRAEIATVAAPIASLEEFLDPNCVKALRAQDGTALYFSRAPVPWPREHVSQDRPSEYQSSWRHIGIYAYRVSSLLKFAGWPPTPLESTERLEQLRALEHGMRIHVVALDEAPPAGIDTPQDLERVRAALLRSKSSVGD